MAVSAMSPFSSHAAQPYMWCRHSCLRRSPGLVRSPGVPTGLRLWSPSPLPPSAPRRDIINNSILIRRENRLEQDHALSRCEVELGSNMDLISCAIKYGRHDLFLVVPGPK